MDLLLNSALFLLTLVLYWLIKRLINDHHNKWWYYFKGPTALPLVGCAYKFKLNRIAFARQTREMATEFGGDGAYLVWVGTKPVVVLTRAHTAQKIFLSHNNIDKSHHYDMFKPWLGEGLLLSSGHKWRCRRKLLTPTFHYSILKKFIDVFNEQAQELVDILYESEGPVDIFPLITRCTLDIICKSAMGVDVGALRNQESDYANAVKILTNIGYRYQRQPWLWNPILYRLSGLKHQYESSKLLVTSFTQEVVNKRRTYWKKRKHDVDQQETSEKLAFLDLLLTMAGDELSDEDIREEVDTFMFLGHETTASGISWALWLIGHHPVILAKIHDELDTVFEDDGPITLTQVNKLTYLDCVIKESMRFQPPVSMIARRLTTPLQFDDGRHIPAGVTTVISIVEIHRDPEQYDQPLTFRPERFLADATNGTKKNPFAFVPFSAGPRNCIGQRFATLEEKCVLAGILRHFTMECMQPINQVVPLTEIICAPSDGLYIKFTKRS